MGRQIETIRPDGGAATNEYDAWGRLTGRLGAGSVPARYAYDAAGRMTNLVDGEGNRTLFAYDALGRLVKKTYADGTFYAYAYNARGWLPESLAKLGKDRLRVRKPLDNNNP